MVRSTSPSASPSPEEVNRQSLIQRKQELEDRLLLVGLKKIQIQSSLGQIDAAEAGLRQEQELAASADRILARRNFAREFCEKYRDGSRVFTTLESIADGVLGVIQVLYPAWMTEPVTATSVAVLCAFTLTKKGLDSFCES